MRSLLMVGFASAAAFAYDFPILQRTLGELDGKDGVVISKSCQIFDKNSQLEQLDAILALVRNAEKEPLQKSVHVVQQVPSEEVFANYPEKFAAGPAATGLRPRKVLLLKDSSASEMRNGPASTRLIKLVEDICKDLK